MRDQTTGRVTLDWRHAGVSDHQRACVLCGRPTLLRSPDKGVPCHKRCAERWYEQHDQGRAAA